MTVDHARKQWSIGDRFNIWFNERFEAFLKVYDRMVGGVLRQPKTTLAVFTLAFAASLAVFPLLGLSFFPRTDAGQFLINLKAPTGTRLAISENEVAKVEALIRQVVSPEDLSMIVSNIGSTPDFSAIYTSNSGSHTSFVQVRLNDDHKTGSYEYMARVKHRLETEMPELRAYFQSGGMVDAVLNLGMPAPIDVQVAGTNMQKAFATANQLAARIRNIPGVADVYIPQDLDYPALHLDVDRTRAGQLGLDQREVVGNLITALTSNQMIAPSFWIDPKNGNDYMLTVQYPENQVHNLSDLRAIPLRGTGAILPARLDAITHIVRADAPTEVDHYQLRRTIDIYVRPLGEGLGTIANSVDSIIAAHQGAGGLKRHVTRHGARYARLIQQLRDRPVPGGGAALPDSGGAVPEFRGSVPDSSRGTPGAFGRDPDALAHQHDLECHVPDGCGDAGGNRGFEQHSDRRVHASLAGRGHGGSTKRSRWPAGCVCVRC